jgi:hypothetical protein
MKTHGSIRLWILASLFAGLVALGALKAEAALVPYDGSFDEATDTITGDYRELGGTDDVGDFELLDGLNLFLGSIVTPGDNSDTFNIILGTGETLNAVSIDFDTGADPFNPIAINQNTNLGLYQFGPPLVLINIPGRGSFAAGSGLPLEAGL